MKKLLALILAMLMVLSLVACSSDSSDQQDKDDTTKAPTEEKEPESTGTTPEENNTQDTQPEASVPQESVPQETVPQESTPQETDPTEPEEPKVEAVKLQDLPTITNAATFYKSSVKDAYGNEYEGPYYDFCSWGRSSNKDEYITQSVMEYNTDGKYSYLTGTFFTRAKQAEDATIELLVYADDELIYCSEPISRRTKAIDLAVYIGNCDVLRIASRSYDYSSNTNPGIILVDGQVCNDYDGKPTQGVAINPDLVPLTDLHVYGSHTTAINNIEVGAVKDSYGNEYKGIYLDLCSYGNYGGVEFDTQAYTDFVANGEYQYLSGTFFTRTGQDASYTIEFLIYADDELVYSSGMIDRSTKAIDFCVDIGNCDMIRVMSRSVDYTDTKTNPGIILVNPIVSTQQPDVIAD